MKRRRRQACPPALWFARTSGAALAFLAFSPLTGCSAPAPRDGEPMGTNSSAIVAGEVSDSSQDFVVRVVDGLTFCTGTLVSPTLVMTAQHCLVNNGIFGGSSTANDYATCTIGTNPIVASDLSVQFGNTKASPTRTVPVSKVFVDVDNDQCQHDIGFVELSQPVTGMPAHPMLLDSQAAIGLAVTGIGWGSILDGDAGYTNPGQRQTKTGTILLSGLAGTAPTPDGESVTMPAGWILTSLTECNGDSGSPVLDTAANALVGVTSGVISAKVTTVDNEMQSDCADGDGVTAALSNNVAFIEEAFQAEGLMPWRVGQATPPADTGGTCVKNNDCNSNYCVLVGTGGSGYCSRSCAVDTDCTNGTTCTATGKAADSGAPSNVCLPPQPEASPRGCDVSAVGANRVSMTMFGVFGALLGGRLLRRKRKPRRSHAKASAQ